MCTFLESHSALLARQASCQGPARPTQELTFSGQVDRGFVAPCMGSSGHHSAIFLPYQRSCTMQRGFAWDQRDVALHLESNAWFTFRDSKVDPPLKFNAIDQAYNVDRRSYTGEYEIVNGVPRYIQSCHWMSGSPRLYCTNWGAPQVVLQLNLTISKFYGTWKETSR